MAEAKQKGKVLHISERGNESLRLARMMLDKTAKVADEDAAEEKGEESDLALEDASSIVRLRTQTIRLSPFQTRSSYDEEQLEELSRSIAEKGVLQPILVRPSAEEESAYELVAGERRLRAARRAGLQKIPAIVCNLEDSQALEVTIVENAQTRRFKRHRRSFELSQVSRGVRPQPDAIAKSIGKIARPFQTRCGCCNSEKR